MGKTGIILLSIAIIAAAIVAIVYFNKKSKQYVLQGGAQNIGVSQIKGSVFSDYFGSITGGLGNLLGQGGVGSLLSSATGGTPPTH